MNKIIRHKMNIYYYLLQLWNSSLFVQQVQTLHFNKYCSKLICNALQQFSCHCRRVSLYLLQSCNYSRQCKCAAIITWHWEIGPETPLYKIRFWHWSKWWFINEKHSYLLALSWSKLRAKCLKLMPNLT